MAHASDKDFGAGLSSADAGPRQPWYQRWLDRCAALQSQPLHVRLIAAAVIVAIAFVIRWWLMAQVGQVSPRQAYPIFYPAVMIAAVVGGASAGVLAVALSVLSVMLWVMPHQSSTDWLGSAMFIAASALTVCLTTALQNAQLKLRQAVTKREADLRFRAVFDQQFQFMAILSPDGRLQHVNDMPLLKQRIRREDVLGLPFADTPWFRNLPDVRADWPRRLAAAAGASGPVTFEDEFNPSDGSRRTADASVTAVRAQDGSVRFFIVQAHDTTEHKQAANALRAHAEQMRLAVEVAQLGFFDHDQVTELLSWSPQMRRIFGWGSNEPVSLETYMGLIHPDDRPAVFAAIQRSHDPGSDGRFSVEHRVVLRDGQVRWVALRSQTMFEGEGDARCPIRTMGVLIDITDRRRLVAELDHRVKNTLELVSAIIDFSRQNAGSMAEFIETFDGRIQAMAKAHELLSRNRWQDVELSELAQQQLVPFTGAARGRASRVAVPANPTRVVSGRVAVPANPTRVAMDGDQIRVRPVVAQALAMLLHELATNAAKYGALSIEGGRVTIDWRRTGTQPEAGQPDRTKGLVLTWRETGGPPVAAPTHRGFGSMLIRELVEYELDGKVDLVFDAAGLHCTVRIPDLAVGRRKPSAAQIGEARAVAGRSPSAQASSLH